MSVHTYQDGLLRQCFDAIGRRDIEAAERIADRLRRTAPASPDLIVIQSQLLLLRRKPADAARLLHKPDVLEHAPLPCTLLISAYNQLHAYDDARRVADFCLGHFAIDAIAETEPFETLASALGAGIGWLGLRSDGVAVLSVPSHDSRLPVLEAEVGLIDLQPAAVKGESSWRSFRSSRSLNESGHFRVADESRHFIGPKPITWPTHFGVRGQAQSNDRRLSMWAAIGWLPSSPATFILRDELRSVVTIEGSLVANGFARKRTILDADAHTLGLHGNRIEIGILLPNGTECPLPGSPLRASAPSAIAPHRAVPSRLASSWIRDNRAPQPTILVIPIIDATVAGEIDYLAQLDRCGPRLLVIGRQTNPAGVLERVRTIAQATATPLLEHPGPEDLAGLLNAACFHVAPSNVLVCMPPNLPDAAWTSQFSSAAMAEARSGIVFPMPRMDIRPFWTDATGPALSDPRDPADISAIAGRVNQVERPPAYGLASRQFHLKRRCLEEVGGFESNHQCSMEFTLEDFSMRARHRGWTTVVAASVLAPAPTQGRQEPARLLRSRDELELRYPGYIDRAEQQGPLNRAHRRIEEALLAATPSRPTILFITLAAEGGVARRVREEIGDARKAGFRVMVLRPASEEDAEGWCALTIDDREARPLSYRLPGEKEDLVSFLKALSVSEICIHHFLGLPPLIFDLPEALSVPFTVTIHDYIWLCPRVNLIRDDRYCEEPGVDECSRCVMTHGSILKHDLSPAALRERSQMIFQRAARIVVPSADTAVRMRRHFPTIPTVVRAWESDRHESSLPETPRSARQGPRVRVAVIGSIGVHKGFRILLDAACDAAANDLPIEFVVIGHTSDDGQLTDSGRITVMGEFMETEVDTMLRDAACDVAFFPSIWPETWCYALTHAMRAGLPILASKLGAFRERLTNYPDAGFFDPASATSDQINCQLIELARKLCDLGDFGVQDVTALTGQSSEPVEPDGTEFIESETDPRSAVVTSQSVVPVSDTGRPALTSTVQVLSLAEGMYAFTVRGAAASSWRENEILVPAIRISPAPFARQKARLTVLSSPAAIDDWLTKPGDVVVVQIAGGSAHLLLTSLSLPNTVPLSIDVRKLDQQADVALPRPQDPQPAVRSAPEPAPVEQQARSLPPEMAAPAPVARTSPAPGTGQRKTLRAQILTHIQNRGDVPFVGGAWAGFLGQRLWIEAFAITLLEGPGKDALEYKGRTAGGFETPWLSNGAWCGTRGMGVPLVEFALRLRPQLALTHECEYSGSFFSGAIVGPTREGLPCRSAAPNDPLEAIQIRLTERAVAGGLSGGSYLATAAS